MDNEPRRMVATAPWPAELEDLCGRARHPDGWRFEVEDGGGHDGGTVTGPRLVVYVRGQDAYHPGRRRETSFHFPIPACTFDRASWCRWLNDRIRDVRAHEDGEGLHFLYERPDRDGNMVTVAERPFAPLHGPGRDPHRVYEAGIPYGEVRVSQDGGRYRGWWWDGRHVHGDEAHDARDGCDGLTCVPVQRADGER